MEEKKTWLIIGIIILALITINTSIRSMHDYSSHIGAQKAVKYLEGYYEQNDIYPSQAEFYNRFDMPLKYNEFISGIEPTTYNQKYFTLFYPTKRKRVFAQGIYRTEDVYVRGTEGYQITSCETRSLCTGMHFFMNFRHTVDLGGKYSFVETHEHPEEVPSYGYPDENIETILITDYDLYDKEILFPIDPTYRDGRMINFSEIVYDKSFFILRKKDIDRGPYGMVPYFILTSTQKNGPTEISYSFTSCRLDQPVEDKFEEKNFVECFTDEVSQRIEIY